MVLKKALRFFFKLLPQDTKMIVLSGKLRGKKWILASGNNACWLGSFETHNQNLFEKYVHSGDVVYDIGAHVGFYTLLSSVLAGERGKVFAFEPLPRNLGYLKQHLEINHLENVTVIEAAVSKESGVTSFQPSDTGYQSSISKTGSLQVKKVSLDELLADGQIAPPNYMKIDVEGHEHAVLQGSKKILTTYHPIILLSIHGKEPYRKCEQFLQDLGYNIEILQMSFNAKFPNNFDLVASYSQL